MQIDDHVLHQVQTLLLLLVQEPVEPVEPVDQLIQLVGQHMNVVAVCRRLTYRRTVSSYATALWSFCRAPPFATGSSFEPCRLCERITAIVSRGPHELLGCRGRGPHECVVVEV